ncbi:MAG: hypothetical protein JW981_04480 [Anaerolineae bacterium]|nr:hypothetical protein [Anaerolineae bacterium]
MVEEPFLTEPETSESDPTEPVTIIDSAADPYGELFEEPVAEPEPAEVSSPPPLPLEPEAAAYIPPESVPPTSLTGTPAAEAQKTKDNTVLIIGIIAAILLLCCCCVVVGWFGWTYGDQIFGLTQTLPYLRLA